MNTHYDTLGLESSATSEEVKKAYFVMAKKYHPDSGDDTEVKNFHLVSEAYKVLSDPEKRKLYDLKLIDAGIEIQGMEKTVIQDEPKHHTTHRAPRAPHRDVELKAFHANRFRKAVFGVVGFLLIFGFIGSVISYIIDDKGLLGAIFGSFIGASLGVNRHFDVSTFFKLKKKQKIFELSSWAIFAIGLGYFVWLIVREIF